MSWLDRIAAAIYKRGQSIVDARDQSLEEQRIAVRQVRDALRDAMINAEEDREHGDDKALSLAVAAANLASATVHELNDAEARELVATWKRHFDEVPKGWKKGRGMYGSERPPGYPEPAWGELRAAAETAQGQLGRVLRELLVDST